MLKRSLRRLRRYGLELAVVFIGVWLGLIAENFRQERQERAEERVSLARPLRDLNFDLNDMKGNLERAVSGGQAVQWLLHAGYQPAPEGSDSVEH